MKGNYKIFTCILLSSFYLMGSTEASNIRDIQIYGPEKGLQISEQSNLNQDAHYTLNLGAFKNKQNALEYQARMQERTGKTVHFAYQPEKDVPYIPVIFENACFLNSRGSCFAA